MCHFTFGSGDQSSAPWYVHMYGIRINFAATPHDCNARLQLYVIFVCSYSNLVTFWYMYIAHKFRNIF